jgi:hypothetical protein
MAITTFIRASFIPCFAAALLACTSSVEDDDAASSGAGGSGASGSGAGASAGATSSSASAGGATSTASSSATGTGGGGGAGGGAGGSTGACDLETQDCPDPEQSCYPTADSALCQPTGDGEAWTQCESNLDCGAGLFCNPHNFMHCVPWCNVAASDCEVGSTCYETDDIDLPEGYGYCLPS